MFTLAPFSRVFHGPVQKCYLKSEFTCTHNQIIISVKLNCFCCSSRVVSHYMHDDASYVPVQDVVKAFRKDFNVDISYKECHQMIFSAFTSPRNRLIPRKTVRVTSIGQQYVYRGIAPLNKAACSSKEIAQVWFIIDLFVFSGYFSFLRRKHGNRTRVSTPANHNTSKQHNVN